MRIDAAFDVATDRGAGANVATVGCARYLAADTVSDVGSGAECVWADAKTLSIYFAPTPRFARVIPSRSQGDQERRRQLARRVREPRRLAPAVPTPPEARLSVPDGSSARATASFGRAAVERPRRRPMESTTLDAYRHRWKRGGGRPRRRRERREGGSRWRDESGHLAESAHLEPGATRSSVKVTDFTGGVSTASATVTKSVYLIPISMISSGRMYTATFARRHHRGGRSAALGCKVTPQHRRRLAMHRLPLVHRGGSILVKENFQSAHHSTSGHAR